MTEVRGSVVDVVVGKDLCIGCGVCSGICPRRALVMEWSDRGELNPVLRGDCRSGCRLCREVCPFGDHGILKDEIAEKLYSRGGGAEHSPETGYVNSCHAGYSRRGRQRERGSSGGMTTWVLDRLIREGVCDAALCVVPAEPGDRERLFVYEEVVSPEALDGASGSKYHPVEISTALRKVLDDRSGRTWALVGLPCLVFGVSLAMRRIPALGRRIGCTLSLVCGKMPNRFYTEALAQRSGIDAGDIGSFDYRIKGDEGGAKDYLCRARSADGTPGRLLHRKELPERLWESFYFVHNACTFCDDVFGETAEAAFMDAWLPEYEGDPRGNTIVLSRTGRMTEILERGRAEGECALDPLPVAAAIRSQRGVLFEKKHLIRGRLYRASRQGKWIPARMARASRAVYYKNFMRIRWSAASLAWSKDRWRSWGRSEPRRFWEADRRRMRFHSLVDRGERLKERLTDGLGTFLSKGKGGER